MTGPVSAAVSATTPGETRDLLEAGVAAVGQGRLEQTGGRTGAKVQGAEDSKCTMMAPARRSHSHMALSGLVPHAGATSGPGSRKGTTRTAAGLCMQMLSWASTEAEHAENERLLRQVHCWRPWGRPCLTYWREHLLLRGRFLIIGSNLARSSSQTQNSGSACALASFARVGAIVGCVCPATV